MLRYKKMTDNICVFIVINLLKRLCNSLKNLIIKFIISYKQRIVTYRGYLN